MIIQDKVIILLRPERLLFGFHIVGLPILATNTELVKLSIATFLMSCLL